MLQLGFMIASFISQDPEGLHKVTEPAGGEAGAGTDVSCLPVPGPLPLPGS